MSDPHEETPVERQRRLRRRLRWPGRLRELTAALVLADPAPRAEIRAAEEVLGVGFPADYVDFVAATNGATGSVGAMPVELWPVTALRAENGERHAPAGLVLFGSFARAGLLAFRTGRFLRIPDREGLSGAEDVGGTLLELLEALAA